MTNSKKKGNMWENKLARFLTDNGVKAYKDGASGGGTREKGDIVNNIDYTIESKAAKKIKLQEWWKQVNKSAEMQKNKPALFIHQDGMKDNEWLVVTHSEDWIDEVMNAKGESIEVQAKFNYTQTSAIDSLKTAISNLEREVLSVTDGDREYKNAIERVKRGIALVRKEIPSL